MAERDFQRAHNISLGKFIDSSPMVNSGIDNNRLPHPAAMNTAFNQIGLQLLAHYDGPLLLRGSSALGAEQLAINPLNLNRNIVPDAIGMQWQTMAVHMRQLRQTNAVAAADIDELAGGSDFDFRLRNTAQFDLLMSDVFPTFRRTYPQFINDHFGDRVLLRQDGVSGDFTERPLEVEVISFKRPNGVHIAQIGLYAGFEDSTQGGGIPLLSVGLVRTPPDPGVNDRLSLNHDTVDFPATVTQDGSMTVEVPYADRPMYTQTVLLQPDWNNREPARAFEIATRALWKANTSAQSIIAGDSGARFIQGAALLDMHKYFTSADIKAALSGDIDERTQRMIRKNLLTAIILDPLKAIESFGQSGVWDVIKENHSDIPKWEVVRNNLLPVIYGYSRKVRFSASFPDLPTVNGWEMFYNACYPNNPYNDEIFLSGICELTKIGKNNI